MMWLPDWRALRGERNKAAKLTVTEVLEVRRLARAGHSHRAIGRRLGIHPTTVGGIVRRATWAHLPEPDDPGRTS